MMAVFWLSPVTRVWEVKRHWTGRRQCPLVWEGRRETFKKLYQEKNKALSSDLGSKINCLCCHRRDKRVQSASVSCEANRTRGKSRGYGQRRRERLHLLDSLSLWGTMTDFSNTSICVLMLFDTPVWIKTSFVAPPAGASEHACMVMPLIALILHHRRITSHLTPGGYSALNMIKFMFILYCLQCIVGGDNMEGLRCCFHATLAVNRSLIANTSRHCI